MKLWAKIKTWFKFPKWISEEVAFLDQEDPGWDESANNECPICTGPDAKYPFHGDGYPQHNPIFRKTADKVLAERRTDAEQAEQFMRAMSEKMRSK
jgi:hypothetical protein